MPFSQNPISNLEELKRRLNDAQDIQVDEEGKLHLPDEPDVKQKEMEGKQVTTIKPTRWF
jgi:hypothetical protein